MPRIGASGPHRPVALTSRSCAGPRWHAGPVQKDALRLRAGPRLIRVVSQLCGGDPRMTGTDRQVLPVIVTRSHMCDVPPAAVIAAVIALLYRSYPGLIVFSSDKSTTLGRARTRRMRRPSRSMIARLAQACGSLHNTRRRCACAHPIVKCTRVRLELAALVLELLHAPREDTALRRHVIGVVGIGVTACSD